MYQVSDIKSLEQISKWIGEVNPDFDPYDTESPYFNNCGSCSLAVFERLCGKKDVVTSKEQIPYKEDMEKLTGLKQVPTTLEYIKESLLEIGNGAHAIVGFDRRSGSGHWFNAACMDGKVYAIDGQDGTITDWPPQYDDIKSIDVSMKKDYARKKEEQSKMWEDFFNG